MKKIFAVLMALIMVVSLMCACGEKEETESIAASEAETEIYIETEDDIVIDDAQDVDAKMQVPELIHPIVAEHYQCAQDDENKFIYEVSWNEISLDDSEAAAYPEMQKAFTELNDKFWDETFTNRNNFAMDYTTAKKDGIEFDPTRLDLNKVTFTRSDSSFISVLKTYDWYGGGAHGGYGYGTYNYDTMTGKKLTLADIVAEEDRFIDVVESKLKDEYTDVEFYDTNNPLTGYTINDDDPDEMKYKFSWSLGYKSLTIYFQQYEIAPYSEGIQVVELPYAGYADLFNDIDKLSSTPVNYASALPDEYDEYGYKTSPYSVQYNGNMYVFSFKELDDEEAVLKVTDEGSDRGMELEGRLATTNEAEEVTGPFDGMHCSQRVTTGRAFVDPMKFELEYLDKATNETVKIEYSAEGFIN